MQLPGKLFIQLRQALVGAFSKSDLSELVLTACNTHLDTVVAEGSLNEMVMELLRWAERTSRIDILLAEAQELNPNNPTLQEAIQQYHSYSAQQWISPQPTQHYVQGVNDSADSRDPIDVESERYEKWKSGPDSTSTTNYARDSHALTEQRVNRRKSWSAIYKYSQSATSELRRRYFLGNQTRSKKSVSIRQSNFDIAIDFGVSDYLSALEIVLSETNTALYKLTLVTDEDVKQLMIAAAPYVLKETKLQSIKQGETYSLRGKHFVLTCNVLSFKPKEIKIKHRSQNLSVLEDLEFKIEVNRQH